MRCTQCKRDRPEGDFLKLAGRGWKVTKCNTCAHENMRRYWRRVELDADRVRRANSDE